MIFRDVATWAFGCMIIAKQAGIGFAPPDQVSDTLIWVSAALVGTPGSLQILAGIFGRGTGMAGLPSSSPSPESSPSSPGV